MKHFQQDQKQNICSKHSAGFENICTAPQCNYFRHMCFQCTYEDPHKKFHFLQHKAFSQTQTLIENIQTGLVAIKTKIAQQITTNLSNNPGLYEVQIEIDQIRNEINSRIDNFKIKIRKLYEQSIRQKLNQLYQIVDKSEIFMKKAKESLKIDPKKTVQMFFKNDFKHELKYYESYFQQIFKKKVRKFKTSLHYDKVMKMIVTFQKNINEIFTFQRKEKVNKNSYLLIAEDEIIKVCAILKKNNTPFFKCKTVIGTKHQQYTLKGIIQSIYYEPNDCLYVFGGGNCQNGKIAKYSYHDGLSNFITVGKMDSQRINFSLCELNKEIFIIGGQNQQEGCLVKCEKYVPFYDNKVYIVSSLNQRSSQHSITTYKDIYILKFGGTDLFKKSKSQFFSNEDKKPLLPEIYSLLTEQWSIIEYKLPDTKRIDFGLFPVIFSSEKKDAVVIFGGQGYLKDNKKPYQTRYDINFESFRQQIVKIKVKISESRHQQKFHIFPCTLLNHQQQAIFMVRASRNQGSIMMKQYNIEFN